VFCPASEYKSPVRHIRLVVEYDGTELCGWQRQANGPTVQGHLEDALGKLLTHPVSVAGASRTDAGVHARGQVASFRTERPIPLHGVRRGLNSLLPDAIADRIEGSGIECRSFATFGYRHKVQVAMLRLVLTENIAVRAGVGLARITPQALPVDAAGFAGAAGVAYTVWSHDGYAVELDAAAAHGRYSTGNITDATMMVIFRSRLKY